MSSYAVDDLGMVEAIDLPPMQNMSEIHLSRDSEDRLQRGETITDYGDDYSDTRDVLASSVGGLRKGSTGNLLSSPTSSKGIASSYIESATQNYSNAELLYEISAKLQKAGNTKFAETYRGMADDYMAAGDKDWRNAGDFYTYSEPMWKNTPTQTTSFGPGWNTGAYSAGLTSNLYGESRPQSVIDVSLDRTTTLLATSPLLVVGAGLSYGTVGLGLGLRTVYSTVGWQGTAALGFTTSSAMDVTMQYYDTDNWNKNGWRYAQTLFAGVVGAATGPLGATSGIKTNIVLGGGGAVLNTQFQNYVYGDDKSLIEPMLAGSFFGAGGYKLGAQTTKGIAYYHPERYYGGNPTWPALFRPVIVNKVPQIIGVTTGGIASGLSPIGESAITAPKKP